MEKKETYTFVVKLVYREDEFNDAPQAIRRTQHALITRRAVDAWGELPRRSSSGLTTWRFVIKLYTVILLLLSSAVIWAAEINRTTRAFISLD